MSQAPPPPPPPPPQRKGLFRRIYESHLIAWTVALIATLAAVGLAATSEDGNQEPTVETGQVAEETMASPSPSPSPTPSPTEEPPPAPDPDAQYTSSCDYVLGDFSENSRTGYRFIAGAEVENAGNIGVEVELRAQWAQLGGRPIRATETAQVAVGRSRSIQVTAPATQDQIDLHQSAYDSTDEPCKAVVALVDTFGEVEG